MPNDDDIFKPLLTRPIVPPSPPPMPPSHLKKHRIWPLLALLILIHLSTVLYTLPLNRVIELRLCQEHYALNEPIPEKLCKIDQVQRQLAWLQGVMETTLVACGTCVVIVRTLSDANTILMIVST
jgi:hypothetical protein